MYVKLFPEIINKQIFFPLVEIKSEKCLDTNGSLPKLSDLKVSYLWEKEKSIEPYKKPHSDQFYELTTYWV